MSTRTENQSSRPALAGVDGARILVVEARFYTDLANTLVAGAEREMAKYGCIVDRVGVPGAFEIPGAIAVAAQSSNYDGYIALGCVIRGETTHYDYVCGESARGLMDLSVRERLAIGYGILTVNTEEQAWARAGLNRGDKGGDAAHACLAMVSLNRRWRPAQ